MPAQSGDPISSALQVSLSGCSSKKDEDVSLLLSYSAKQILLSDIKCEEFSYDSTTFLKGLKSKYTVISEKDVEDKSSKSSANCYGSSDKPKISVSNSADRSKSVERVNFTERTEVKTSSKPSLPTPSRTLWSPDAVSLGWKPNTPVGGGFVNLWNSCYINSTLQALFHIPGFVNWLLMEESHKCPNKSSGSADCLICSMAQTLKNSQESTGKAIKPCLIYNRLKSICKHLNPGTQEDAHEFLRHLVDSLDRTYLIPFKDLRLDHLSKETTPLSQIFGGYLRNEVVCQACGHVSTTFQYFQDLPLDIANSSHIDGALDLFFSRESVSEHEGYRCENCKRRVPFTKKFSLEKAPKVLCVQLKRFGAVSGKNNKSIYMAGKLNLNRFRSVKTGDNFEPYQLVAVVNHIGTSTSCGHYTAIAMAADNRFYLFDDQRVERLHDLSPSSSQAYILLYHQKPIVPNGIKPGLSSKLVNSSSVKTSVQPAVSQESAKEKIFGKAETNSNSKNPFKLFNSNVLTKVSAVSYSISNVFSKVNGNGAGCSNSNSGKAESANASSNQANSPKKNDSGNKTEKENAKKHEGIGNKSDKDSPKKSEVSARTSSVNSESSKEKPALEFSATADTTRIQNGHKSSFNNKSLVPYNESSCSSEDGSWKGEDSCPQTPEPAPTEPGPSPPKKLKFDSEKDSSDSSRVRANGNASVEKNGASPSNRLNGHSSPGKPKYSNGNSNIGQSFGKSTKGWMVTLRSPSTSPSKSESPKNNWKVKGSDEGRNEHKSHLMAMSHRGYGKPVSSWSGDTSEMDKEVSRESYMNQRMSNYKDSYDMPNKKVKRYHGRHKSGFDGRNRFNEAQKRKIDCYNNPYRDYRIPGDRRRNKIYGEPFYKFKPWHLL